QGDRAGHSFGHGNVKIQRAFPGRADRGRSVNGLVDCVAPASYTRSHKHVIMCGAESSKFSARLFEPIPSHSARATPSCQTTKLRTTSKGLAERLLASSPK